MAEVADLVQEALAVDSAEVAVRLAAAARAEDGKRSEHRAKCIE